MKLRIENVEQELRKRGGNKAAVARALGCTRQAVHNFIARHESLKDVVEECRESMKDVAEDSLQKAVKNGESWAVCFYLKTQGRDRGYQERSELNLGGSVRLAIVEEIVDNDPADPNEGYQAP